MSTRYRPPPWPCWTKRSMFMRQPYCCIFMNTRVVVFYPQGKEPSDQHIRQVCMRVMQGRPTDNTLTSINHSPVPLFLSFKSSPPVRLIMMQSHLIFTSPLFPVTPGCFFPPNLFKNIWDDKTWGLGEKEEKKRRSHINQPKNVYIILPSLFIWWMKGGPPDFFFLSPILFFGGGGNVSLLNRNLCYPHPSLLCFSFLHNSSPKLMPFLYPMCWKINFTSSRRATASSLRAEVCQEKKKTQPSSHMNFHQRWGWEAVESLSVKYHEPWEISIKPFIPWAF